MASTSTTACVRQTMGVKGTTERLVFQFNGPYASSAAGGCNAAMLQNNAGPISLYSASGDGVFVDAGSGNVGIKTTAPRSELDVAGTVTASVVTAPLINAETLYASGAVVVTGLLTASNVRVLGTYETVNAFESHSSNVYIENIGTETGLIVKQVVETTQAVAAFYAGEVPALYVTSDANVAVGKDVAAHALDVSGTARSDYFLGDGSLLTALNATEVMTGTLNNARLPQVISITGDFTTTANATVTGNLSVGSLTMGASSTTSSMQINGPLVASSNSTFNGVFVANSTATFTSNVTMTSNLAVNGVALFDSNVTISGSTTLNGPLVTNALATFASNVTMASDLHVVGKTTLDSELTVTGLLTASNVRVLGGFETVYAYVTHSSNVVIDNQGTGPALSVKQIEDTAQPVAGFYAGDSPALYVTSDAFVAIGKETAGYALDVSGTAHADYLTISGSTTLGGALVANSAVTVSGTTLLSGAATLASTLGVAGAATMGDTLAVVGATTLGGVLVASSNVAVSGTTSLAGAATLESTLAVTGATTLNNSLTVAGGATALGGVLGVAGATTLSDTLAVVGATTLGGVLVASSNVAVSGTTLLSGAATLASTLGVAGAATLSDTLAVVGATTLGGVLVASSNVSVSGATSLAGAATLGSTLAVAGATTLSNSLTVAGTGATALGGVLGVAGATTLGGALVANSTATFASNVAMDSALNVDGIAWFGQNVAIGGTFDPAFALDVSGSIRATSQSVFGPTGSVVDPSGAQLRVDGDARVDGSLQVGDIIDASGVHFVRESATLWYEGAVSMMMNNGTALNVGTGGAITCRYMQLGTLVTAEISVVFGSDAYLGTATNPWNFSLPVAPGGAFNNSVIGSAFLVNADSANYTATVVANSATADRPNAVAIYTNMSSSGVTGTDFTWVAGDSINMSLTYESATRPVVIPPMRNVLINTDGTSIGINKTPMLDLPAGSVDVTGAIVAGGDIITATGSVSAVEMFSTSDRRLKSNIVPLMGSLDKIQALTGVSFTFNATGRDSIGLVAQDVQAILPEIVSTNDAGFLSVNYGSLVGLLVEGMKDLSQRLAALEAPAV